MCPPRFWKVSMPGGQTMLPHFFVFPNVPPIWRPQSRLRTLLVGAHFLRASLLQSEKCCWTDTLTRLAVNVQVGTGVLV
eukprot:scaffold4052_cov64-Attheya_sp.AAC.3